MRRVTPGVCRWCGCDELHACRLETGEPCCWADAERTVCSRPACLAAQGQRMWTERAARPRSEFAGWGLGAIRLELERRRKVRRRKRRAP